MKTYSLRFSNGKRSFDKYIGDDYYYALYYIKTNNGNDNEHFISYRGGTVSIIETNTNNVYYTEKIETMADITKCNNRDCPLRYSCYRFNAPDGVWQSYNNFEFRVDSEEIECDYYINIKDYE